MKQVADILNLLPDTRINMIDVGCCGSVETRDFVYLLPTKEMYTIGIDPIVHDSSYAFTHFVRAAVRNCSPSLETFYNYSDKSCSSLLKVKDNVTHNPDERTTKWYAGHVFEKLVSTETVRVIPLTEVIKEFKLENSVIHFLKIDAQGVDIEVFLSLGQYIKNCLFFQMETVTSHSKDIVLYEGQSIYEDEKPIIEKYGFEFLSMIDYGAHGASQEGDVIYVNTKLLRKLQNG